MAKKLGMEEQGPMKKIAFDWYTGEHLWLGVPVSIFAEPRRFSAEGCKLGFSTLSTSAGINDKFALSLGEADICKITEEMWSAYLEVNPKALKKLLQITLAFSKAHKKKTRKK